MRFFSLLIASLILLVQAAACAPAATALRAVGLLPEESALPAGSLPTGESQPPDVPLPPAVPEPPAAPQPPEHTATPEVPATPTAQPSLTATAPRAPSQPTLHARRTLAAAPAATPLPAAISMPAAASRLPAWDLPPQGGRVPWQFFDGALAGPDALIYRLRYPAGWIAAAEAGGGAVFQNFAGALPADMLEPGAIQLELSFLQTGRPGGLPPPNQRLLAAGLPGTRQILVDAASGQTAWNVRLYGLHQDATALLLTGQLAGSPAEVESGIRLLDAMLQSLELYADPDPLPDPLLPEYSPAEGWPAYRGRLPLGASALESDAPGAGAAAVVFRLPPGWWVYAYGDRFIDVTNYVVDPRDASPLPDAPGSIKLSISATGCEALGGCPERPPLLGNGRWRGEREIAAGAQSATTWTVQIYHEQARYTLFAVLVGDEAMAEQGILLLNMLLRTLELVPMR